MPSSGGRQIPVQSTAPLTPSVGDLWVDTAGAGAGSDNVLPAATAFTTTTMPNPITSGNMTVLVFPSDIPALAIALQGDAYPRWLFSADAADGVYFGNGTTDPFAGRNQLGIGITQAGEMMALSGTNGVYLAGGDVMVGGSADGYVLWSPNNTRYRITVNNDGSLSTTVVP